MGKVLQAITGSTKRIVGIMAHDFQRVFTNPVAAIIAVGVMVLPSLYARFIETGKVVPIWKYSGQYIRSGF